MPETPTWDFDEIEAGRHGCTMPGCKYADSLVCYDDEPYCFTHSPDEGSSVLGYSYKASLTGSTVDGTVT